MLSAEAIQKVRTVQARVSRTHIKEKWKGFRERNDTLKEVTCLRKGALARVPAQRGGGHKNTKRGGSIFKCRKEAKKP